LIFSVNFVNPASISSMVVPHYSLLIVPISFGEDR
jgi:hypothetical protein